MGELELLPHDRRTDLVDQGAMGMSFLSHAASYQHPVDDARALSLIACARAMLVSRSSMKLGERIKAAWKRAGYSSERKAAEALDWSAQRLNNYTKKDRPPDLDSLLHIARTFGTTPDELLGISGPSDSELLDILRRLLELEGLPTPRADMIAEVALASLRQLQRLPGDRSPELPGAVAQTIWTERFESATDRSPRP